MRIALTILFNLVGFAIMDHVAPHDAFSPESFWILAGAICFGLAGVSVSEKSNG